MPNAVRQLIVIKKIKTDHRNRLFWIVSELRVGGKIVDNLVIKCKCKLQDYLITATKHDFTILINKQPFMCYRRIMVQGKCRLTTYSIWTTEASMEHTMFVKSYIQKKINYGYKLPFKDSDSKYMYITILMLQKIYFK